MITLQKKFDIWRMPKIACNLAIYYTEFLWCFYVGLNFSDRTQKYLKSKKVLYLGLAG
ncbi:MAG: hypothetical protein HEQ27_06255 [Dolichospermum sp. JUN01]|nr:hypothetical protein [Dolichospermum sp. JUN01]